MPFGDLGGVEIVRDYKKPELTQVKLVASEAVLTACKTGFTGFGYLNNACCERVGIACQATSS